MKLHLGRFQRILFLFFFAAMHFVGLLNAQSFQIVLDQKGEDNEQNQLLEVLPLFWLNTDSVCQPIDMSSDFPGMRIETRKILMPKVLQNRIESNTVKNPRQFAYGFVFQQNAAFLHTAFRNHTLILVENAHAIRYRPAQIWVDKNHNLDLNDDGPPQVFLPPYSDLKLDDLSQGVCLNLSFFETASLLSYQKLYQEAVELIKGNRHFVGCAGSFRMKRQAVWYNLSVVDGDSIYWAVKDVNMNGVYNDLGVDLLMMSETRGNFNTSNGNKYEEGMKLDWLGRGFKVEKISQTITKSITNNTAIILNLLQLPPGSIKNAKSLMIGETFPNFRYCQIIGRYQAGKLKENPVKENKISDLKGKYTLIVVWNADDPSFHRDSAALHDLSRNLPDLLQILMLNHGGGGKYVYRYNKRYETQFLQGFCSSEVADLLKLQTMPQYFFIDPQLKIISLNEKPESIKKRLIQYFR